MTTSLNLHGINIVEYLKRHLWIGQIDPWRRHDNGDPVLCLLTAVEPALEEIRTWTNNPEITRSEFVKELQSKNIFVFRSIEEFEKYKEKKIEPRLKLKKDITPERRIALQEQAKKMNALKRTTKKPSTTQNPQ